MTKRSLQTLCQNYWDLNRNPARLRELTADPELLAKIDELEGLEQGERDRKVTEWLKGDQE